MMKHIPTIFLSVSLIFTLFSCRLQDRHDGHIREVSVVTEVFGDTQKVTAVVIEYSIDVRSAVSPDDFIVKDRIITDVYTNEVPKRSVDGGTDGKYVIIELYPDEHNAIVSVKGNREGWYPPEVTVQQVAPIEMVTKPYTPASEPIKSENRIEW